MIEQLQLNPQVTNKQLARTLSVAEATVATRLRNLTDQKLIQITAQRDVHAMGYDLVVHVDITVRGAPVMAVARQLAEIKQINGVALFAGEPQITLQVYAADRSELLDLMENSISRIKGIANIESSIALEVLKYNNQLAVLSEQ